MARDNSRRVAETLIPAEDVTEPSRHRLVSTRALFEFLGLVGQTLSTTLGDWCEVVVHDLDDLDHSIVAISGNVTGRKVGGHITDLGLAKIRAGETEPLMNYTTYTDDGKTVKSSSIFLHDEDGQPMGAVCLNLNVTPVLLFSRFLQSLAERGQEPDVTEFFAEDLDETIDTIMAEAAYEAGKPLSVMIKDDRMRMVALLEERGIFQLRKSVPLVAKRLGVTRKTIYNYLAELSEERSTDR